MSSRCGCTSVILHLLPLGPRSPAHSCGSSSRLALQLPWLFHPPGTGASVTHSRTVPGLLPGQGVSHGSSPQPAPPSGGRSGRRPTCPAPHGAAFSAPTSPGGLRSRERICNSKHLKHTLLHTEQLNISARNSTF